MNKDIKKRWVAALRSGEYRQGRSALRTPSDTYCCLGVLCDLAVRDNVIPQPHLPHLSDTAYHYGKAEHTGSLPMEVVLWAGLDSLVSPGNPTVIHNGDTNTLINLNDYVKLNFDEIAHAIEISL